MSLDGFIAAPNDDVGPLFEWYGNGDVRIDTADHHTFKVTAASAEHVRLLQRKIGTVVTGRRLFDYTNGWSGTHPWGTPVVVVTHHDAPEWRAEHPDAPFTFVTDGLDTALDVALEKAGGRTSAWAAPTSSSRPSTSGRGPGQPHPRAARVGHPVLRQPQGHPDPAGQPHGHRGRPGHPPPLRGPVPVTGGARTPARRARSALQR
jgi:dihydrofolate reductase